MDLFLAGSAPCVERVINDHSSPQQLMIIREYGRKAERDGKQARGLRRELRPAGIRTAHDHRQLGQGWIDQLIALQKGIETAEFPHMGQFDVRHVICLSRHCQHARSGN
jgi:hypothetical protein